MEFVVVTHHKKPNSCETGLKDMSILSIPDALLVYTGCTDKSNFAQSIVHISFAFDCVPKLTEHKYCSVNGTLVFRHVRCFRTAIMSIVSEKILLESGEIYCINKITNIAWQEDDGLCEFLGVLEAKIRLKIVNFTSVTRNDIKHVAVASSDVTIRDDVKHPLRFLRCDFGINVVYKEEGGTKTRRSVLFPATLLDVEEIVHNHLYSILTMKPTPSYVFASKAHKAEFGVDPCDKRVDLESFISQYHTAHEMERIKLEVIPQMATMSPGEQITPILEFCTPNGRILYEVTIINIRRSCMAVTFQKMA